MKMTRAETKRLKEISSKMRDLCAELKAAQKEGATEDELESLFENRAGFLCEVLENEYQLYLPVFKLEVEDATIKDFFTLRKLFYPPYADPIQWRSAVKARAARAGR
jgi:hypothetical protein